MYGDPIAVSAGAGPEELERIRGELETVLHRLSAQAAAHAARGRRGADAG